MKICHVTSAHPVEDGRIFRRACIASAQAGFETFLVERGESYVKDNVNIIGVGNPESNSRLYRFIFFSKKVYNAALKVDADLYHLHDPELLPYALKLKNRGKAVVFDSHENYTVQIKTKPYLPRVIAVLLSFMYEKYSQLVFKRIDGFTYPGGEESIPFTTKCKRITTTNNYPWLDEFYNKYEESIEKVKNSICYIGGLSKERGIEQLIRAAYYSKCKLYLAGNYSSKQYQKRVEQMKEYECVRYLGFINSREVLNFLAKMEIGVCILLDYGQYYQMTNLPTKVYEYMSMGLPVILNDSEYNKSIVEKYSIGVCANPLDVCDVSNKIRGLLNDKKLRLEYGNNGRNLIKEKYCWDKEKDKLISLYKDILRNR